MNVVIVILSACSFCLIFATGEPSFVGVGSNVTVVVGRDATLTCAVHNLHNYKVAWLRVDTQTILTIGPHVITKNHRVGVTRGDLQTWSLTIRDARPSDGGRYMCQINTEPMITQTHYLQILVPPDIKESGSSEVMVREGESVSLHCSATGTPQSTITWRREDSAYFTVGKETVTKWSGEWLNVTAVDRKDNGAFLCIATNGVPPAVSKRTILHVLCKPKVWVYFKMIGAYIGESAVLQCNVEANPTPLIYWTHIDSTRLHNGSKYQAIINSEQAYKHSSTLIVSNVTRDDIGFYFCHAENSMGTAQDDVTLYTLATTTTTVMTTPSSSTTTQLSTQPITYADLEVLHKDDEKELLEEDNYVVVLSQHQMQSLDMSPSS